MRAEDGATGNAVLRADMLISSGFIATLLLLVAPRTESVAMVIVGAAILFGSDRLELDSTARRRRHRASWPRSRACGCNDRTRGK